jgi:outer membrane murein-binding lipoprotein Lpp
VKVRIHLIPIIAAVVLALLAGCVSRVAPHDAEIAAGLAELQASHARFFDELQRTAGTPDAAWECHAAWYEETRARIAALRTRAESSGLKDDPTPPALELLDQTLDELEAAHAEGLSSGEISVLRTLLDSQLRALIQRETAKVTP